MNRPIRIGICLQPQHADYTDLRAAAARSEEKGVDIVYTWDHFYPLFGDADGKHFECWTTLASFAEVTEKVEIGPLVACYSYRNPHLLADMARTVDHISGGRLILGLGSGWFERDYDEYEYPFGTAGGRLRDFEAGLYKITRRLKNLNPPPLRELPILIGGGGEKVTLRLTARYADIWHGFGNAEKIAHKNAVLDDWCHTFDRDPGKIERSASMDPKKLENADSMIEAGVTQITLGFGGPDYDLSVVDEWIAWRDERNT
jgi:probable F420-dependent oxidoreductase